MSDRALIVAALIIGGAVVTASLETQTRFALSAADRNVAWRMDARSGQIDICAAVYTPKGPVVRCGAYVAPSETSTAPNDGPQTPSSEREPPGNAAPDQGDIPGGKTL